MRSLGALLLALVCAASPAQAQSSGREQARVLAGNANELYQQGNYAQAAVLLERAYALHPTPTLVFNAGRAYEADGQLARAIDAYQRYLLTGVSDLERRDVEEKIVDLEARLAAENVDPVERDPVDPELPETPPPAPREPPYGALVVGGLGVAGLAIAIGFGASALDLSGRAETEPVALTAAEWIATAQTFATVANVFFVVGGIATIAGGIWAIVELTSGGPDPQTTLRLGPGSLALRQTF